MTLSLLLKLFTMLGVKYVVVSTIFFRLLFECQQAVLKMNVSNWIPNHMSHTQPSTKRKSCNQIYNCANSKNSKDRKREPKWFLVMSKLIIKDNKNMVDVIQVFERYFKVMHRFVKESGPPNRWPSVRSLQRHMSCNTDKHPNQNSIGPGLRWSIHSVLGPLSIVSSTENSK